MRHRMGQAELLLLDEAAGAIGGREVLVRQVRQKFHFGANIYSLFDVEPPALEQAYEERFGQLFNYATLPFYLSQYQPAPETTARVNLTRMAEHCRRNGLLTKGHPLVWHEMLPAWITEIPQEDVGDVLMARVRREVGDFPGLIDIWDVVNEAVALPRYKPNPVTELCGQLGRVELIANAFAAARQANPSAILVLNDYDTTAEYERLIEECLAKGVSFDVIGIQSHMHKGYLGAEKIWDVCERFARFGKPLHWTEATILSGDLKTDDDWHGPHPGWDTTVRGEATQAAQVDEFYKLLFGHPAVEAITWWDFSDHAAWQGAPSGLLRKDMTPKPAFDLLLDLIKKQWWTQEHRLRSDGKGKVRFQGYLGEYELEMDGKRKRFHLSQPGKNTVQITL